MKIGIFPLLRKYYFVLILILISLLILNYKSILLMIAFGDQLYSHQGDDFVNKVHQINPYYKIKY